MQRDEAYFVYNDEFHSLEILQKAVECTLVVALKQEVGQRCRCEEPHPPSGLAGFQGDGRGQVCLSGAYGAKEDKIFFPRQELQISHILPCQANRKLNVLVPDEVLKGLDDLETSGLDHSVDSVDLTLPKLQLQQLPYILFRVLKVHAPPSLCHAAQLQCPHILLYLFRHGKHLLSGCRKPRDQGNSAAAAWELAASTAPGGILF